MSEHKKEKPNSHRRNTLYTVVIKRALDLIFSLIGLIISLPFILIACVFVVLDSPGFPIFSQERVGYKGRIFRVYKLRTMTTRSHDKNGVKIRDRDRVTTAGRIIRKLSVDEFPQFFNILKGDMSFIGPRPLLVRYYSYYTHEELHRHDVRPGITGLAQINGRSDLQWEKRFSFDLQYVKQISFKLDLKILAKTIAKVLKRESTSTIRPPDLVDFDIHRAGQERVD